MFDDDSSFGVVLALLRSCRSLTGTKAVNAVKQSLMKFVPATKMAETWTMVLMVERWCAHPEWS